MKRPPSPQTLLERDVTKQIKDFMEFRQWRAIRFQRTIVPGQFQTGEPGIADYLFVRYLNTELLGLSVTCWIELKRSHRGRLGEDQVKWRDRERRRGAIVLKANDVKEFERAYEAIFGWLRTESWVTGQQQIGFEEVSNNTQHMLTSNLEANTKSGGR